MVNEKSYSTNCSLKWQVFTKELSFCQKLKFSNLYIFIPDGVNRWFFKLRLFDLTKFIVWNIIGLQHRFAKIKGCKISVCVEFVYLIKFKVFLKIDNYNFKRQNCNVSQNVWTVSSTASNVQCGMVEKVSLGWYLNTDCSFSVLV